MQRGASCEDWKTALTEIFVKILADDYLRNRKRIACVYGVIMHAGNVGRIREKRVNTRRSRIFYTFLEYSPNIPRVHYRTINARDEFFYFFYNISGRYYIVNNFTQKIDVEILLTCAQ